MTYAERYVGFYLAFLLPTVSFCIVLPILYGCRNWYRHTAPEGSVLGPALKLLFLAMKGRIHANPVRTYRDLNDGTFWEAVKPSKMDPSRRRAWMTYDDAWVDEVARGFRACTVFLWYPLYCICPLPFHTSVTNDRKG
jgi:POT family proton-dependent oligopeptide transporter